MLEKVKISQYDINIVLIGFSNGHVFDIFPALVLSEKCNLQNAINYNEVSSRKYDRVTKKTCIYSFHPLSLGDSMQKLKLAYPHRLFSLYFFIL